MLKQSHALILLERNYSVSRKASDLPASGQTIYVFKKNLRPIHPIAVQEFMNL